MADVLVPEGTLILREDLTELGRITRATASSAWIGELRLVGGGGVGRVRPHSSKHTEQYIVDGSRAHERAIDRLAFTKRQQERTEVHREAVVLVNLAQCQTGRRDDETHEQHVLRLRSAVRALREALGVPDDV